MGAPVADAAALPPALVAPPLALAAALEATETTEVIADEASEAADDATRIMLAMTSEMWQVRVTLGFDGRRGTGNSTSGRRTGTTSNIG